MNTSSSRSPETKGKNGSNRKKGIFSPAGWFAKNRMWKERFQPALNSSRPQIVFIGTLVFTILVIYWLIRPPASLLLNRFELNKRSPRVVQAPFEFDYEDQIATEAKREEEEQYVSPIYRKKPEQEEAFFQRLRRFVDLVQESSKGKDQSLEEWLTPLFEEVGFEIPNRTYDLSEELAEEVPRSTYESLVFYQQYNSLWQEILTHVKEAAGVGIADEVTPLRKREEKSPRAVTVGAVLVDPDGDRGVTPAVNKIRSFEEYLEVFRERLSVSFPGKIKDYAAREMAVDLVRAAFPGPWLVYDKETTEKNKQKAREQVETVIRHVNKEETIIGKNENVTPQHLQKLKALQERMSISPYAEMGYLTLAVMFVFIVLRYLKGYHKDIYEQTKRIGVIFAGVLLMLGLSRVGIQLSLMELGSNTLRQVGYSIPIGALGVIVTILACSRLALFLCMWCAVFMGIIYSGATNMPSVPYVIVAGVTSCGAIYTVSKIRQRSDLYNAGGVAILLASITILALTLLQHNSLEEFLEHSREVKFALIWGAVNGGLISILSMALLPLFEEYFGVTTDIKLLELSQKNELLSRLEHEAPGSYQHSMRVATLAESAAEAIGANALLTRIGCYYHDIGKIHKPQYYVENQQTRADKAKHDKMKPSMSCMIIRKHVSYGLELARQYKLPKVITDFIPEHHGTMLMTYFYNQALQMKEPEGSIKEEDFRYGGPKPQSKETAIVMLADSLEAASRTLKEPSEGEVRQLVKKLSNERFMDGQFEECNLTMKELHQLENAFAETILHTLHQRIEYPSSARTQGEMELREKRGLPSAKEEQPVYEERAQKYQPRTER